MITILTHAGHVPAKVGKSIADLVSEFGVVSVFVGDRSVAQWQGDGLSDEQIEDISKGEGVKSHQTHAEKESDKTEHKPVVTFAKGDDRIVSDTPVDRLVAEFGADCVFVDGVACSKFKDGPYYVEPVEQEDQSAAHKHAKKHAADAE